MAKRKATTRRPPGQAASARGRRTTPRSSSTVKTGKAAAAKGSAKRATASANRPAAAAKAADRPGPKASPRLASKGAGRERRQTRRVEEAVMNQVQDEKSLRERDVQTPPSSLDRDRFPSAARSGRAETRKWREQHTHTNEEMAGGDVDADIESAYSVGDEAPGGDNPTPDQDVVEEIGKALGVEYQDTEELKGSAKIAARDRHRWELDPASSADYEERARERRPKGRK